MIMARQKTNFFILALLLMAGSVYLFTVKAETRRKREVSIYIDLKGGELFPTGGSWNLRAFPRATLYSAVLGQLVYISVNGTPSAGLLESWESDSSFQNWTFRLRRDLKFHNGRQVNSHDLEFSLVRHLLSAYETPEKELLSNIQGSEQIERGTLFKSKVVAGVEVVDESSIKIYLKNPDPYLPQNYALSELAIVPIEEMQDDYLSWKAFPIGAGPYRVESVSNDKGSVLLRLENRQLDLAPDCPEVIRIDTDPTRSGDVDVVVGLSHNPNPKKLSQEVFDVPSTIRTVFFNYSTRLARDPNFRKALANAIDRSELASQLPNTSASSSMIPSNFGLIKHGVSKPDLAKATSYLSKVKELPNEIVIPVFETGEIPKWYDLIKHQLEKIGLTVRIERTDKKLLEFKSENSPLEILGFIPDVGDAATIFNVFRQGGPYVPVLEGTEGSCARLLQAVYTSTDLERRIKLIQELDQKFGESVYALPLFEEKLTYFVNTAKITDWDKPFQMQTLIFHRLHIRSP